MWLKLNGTDITNYYIDNSDGQLKVKLKNKNKYIAYELDKIDIGLIEYGVICENQVIICSGNISISKNYKRIRDKSVGISIKGK